MTNIYRKLYESHYGPIPIDELGRSYHIHHIDGDRNNNDISNLKCVSIKEHYDIHYKQQDWGACYKLAQLMKLSADQISELSRKRALKMVQNGTHPFLGPSLNERRVKNGTHNLLGGDIQRKIKHKNVNKKSNKTFKSNRTLAILKTKEFNNNRVKNGTHPFLGPSLNETRIKNGTHNTLVQHKCPHCGKTGKGPPMMQWHFDRCRFKRT